VITKGQALILAAAALAGVVAVTSAEDHRREGRPAAPATNATYTATCGTCHVPYYPGLLPAGSWKKILAGLKDHHGQEVSLEPKERLELLTFLSAHAADQSDSEISRKILRSLAGATPMRVTEVPMIRNKHREISDDTFKSKEIGSRSNCAACHSGAAVGNFDEDSVRIPGRNREREDD